MSTQNPIFVPGPTNIPERLRRAVDYPSIDHRSPAFAEMYKPALEGVRRILQSKDAEIILFPATGTGAWEAAITNTLSPGDKVLAARYGMFSHRWIDLCKRHGLDVQVIETPWGAGAPAAEFNRALKADKEHRIKAVLVCHNETATGVVSDIAAVRRAIDTAKHPALLYVDGVSSIASMDFRMDEWGIDIAITGSQKGFMLPAGLAILGASPKAMEAMASARCPRCFFDFRDMLESASAGGFPYTPPVNLIRGLSQSIAMLEEEGLPRVFSRHHRIAEGVRKAVDTWGLSLCAREPSLYSDTVSAVTVPAGFDATRIVTHAAEKYGVAFGVGLGEVAGKVFRIGHLGSMTDVMALSGIATAEMVMADLGLPIALGSGVRAAQEFYRAGQTEDDASAVSAAA
ncbi:L-aspartate--glyoxylate aminotransferase BhcA [Chelativorans salis]|uniref:Aminotransferase class V-fold PLP-dependent enzyme n=1 Tax=Chelativorans salis TaxID=2978478 RepID=A0ABT2LTD9_9HYPH|nr:L-aspartate--glyoxylate aminotransferase BhcA [Chelativorans sp. EGI FJ00035]MCT7377797.1 aminotransferase class V-fold PLP-dependent enzyme [Chelativorans sp. EGI FJ00035]